MSCVRTPSGSNNSSVTAVAATMRVNLQHIWRRSCVHACATEVAGRDTSWRALLINLRQKAAAPGASQQLVSEVATVALVWGSPGHEAPLQGGPKAATAPPRVQLWFET